jgi:hypothetical protein
MTSFDRLSMTSFDRLSMTSFDRLSMTSVGVISVTMEVKSVYFDSYSTRQVTG